MKSESVALAFFAGFLFLDSPSRAQPACADLVGTAVGDGIVLEALGVIESLSLSSRFGGQSTLTGPACIVRGQIKPTANSDIRFEVWLPSQENWNGRLQTVGNGGNAGTIIYSDMSDSYSAGYATVGTDAGHVGAMSDSSYAVGNPEQVLDFGWRSLEEVPRAAKEVVSAYYGRNPDLAIFNGCSTGGRQALEIAQRFPELYDGIVAGAPAAYWPELNALHADFGKFLLSDPAHWVSQAKLEWVQANVHKACSANDGIIDDPEDCDFAFDDLACGRHNESVCLTDGEVASLNKRYADLVDENGKLIYPGFTHGAEAELGSAWMGDSSETRFYSSSTWLYPEGFFRDYVHADPNWTVREFDLPRDLFAARHGVIGVAVYAQDPDLSGFYKAGGKLLMWHGWHDMGIPAANSVRYYKQVLQAMGGHETVDRFVRLFMGTGVGHCGGGAGPNVIGGISAPERDSRHDIVEALARWLADGTAPELIVASRVNNDGEVTSQRPWCAYPAVAQWDGKSDRSKVESYSCQK